MPRRGIRVCLFVLLMTYVLPLGLGAAAAEKGSAKGQLVYVPVYSHVYYGKTCDTRNKEL